ncbi:ATP-binding protein [Acinetobacter pittii]|uniref:ATP-binding protein n=1 Tax=Acinetobacter calcoaceticus/baumannii complex TaxID=909768 RepID=UPI000449C6CC|nr:MULTISPECIES: ATP-binding protein [Acinetobacter calcoaceticus/baumannii complex]EXR38541.1 histidine kinase-, DNA gyrase B-, and HSP90-like ATPase family protein [Acinetobacter sp. 1294243]MCK0878554.1 ATP-binding protein [Acinetobacter pittii]OCY17112.1 hypothetical protein BFR62_16130 [Acinetobacter pittii]RSO88626.1 ATP-binding protein [Acinetobacter pittii]
MTIEKLHFKTSSGIKSIVGKDLITDKFVAIFELVKNSYDAGAKQVTITFDKDKITILDDGHGMSKNDLVEKWLNLAYSEKKEGTLSKKDRVYVGSKGIGRFSADRLGAKLKITTKTQTDKSQHELLIDWEKFDLDLKSLFEEISIDYKEIYVSNSKLKAFTQIDIFELHENWSHDDIAKVKESLRRLKNPFVDDDGFKILFIDSTDLLDVKEYIKSNIAEVLKDKSITVEAKFEEDINVKLFDRGEKIYEIEADNTTVLRTCPIKVNVNYLTISAKSAFTKKMKVEPVNYGNIFIYKNNFRVLPYGDTDYDLFGLNMRKTQGHSRYLGTREIIGFIEIYDKKNSFFKETSSRNSGFVNSIYLQELQNLFMDYIIRPLEHYMDLISWGEFKLDKNAEETQEVFFDELDLSETEKFKRYISRKKKIVFFKNELNFENNKPEKKLEILVEKISKDEKRIIEPIVREVKKQVTDLKKVSKEQEIKFHKQEKDIKFLEHQNHNLAARNRTSESYIEQITHHFTDLSERIYYDASDLFEVHNKIENAQLQSEILSVIKNLKGYIIELEDFKSILIDTNYDVKSAVSNLNWIDMARWFFERKKNNRDFKVIISVDESLKLKKWLRSTRVLDLTMMFENFYKNSKEHGASFLNIEFLEEKIIFSNNSTPIPEELLLKVFDDGFSTKYNGSGIGLNQVKKFLDSQSLSVDVKNSNGLVVFEIL